VEHEGVVPAPPIETEGLDGEESKTISPLSLSKKPPPSLVTLTYGPSSRIALPQPVASNSPLLVTASGLSGNPSKKMLP
jgi:hypothetical protein